jgi:hypothetical protein
MRRLAFSLLLVLGGLLLTACPQSSTPATSTLTISPATVTVTEGGTQAFTATLQGSNEAITWTLGSAVGSIAPMIGTTTTYTAPASVAAPTQVTLTASAGTLSASATITVQPAGASTITVSGRVVKFTGEAPGDPAVGVEVQIHDAAGLTISTLDAELEPQLATDSQGRFTLAGVTPPYTLSVIPPSGLFDDIPQTWENVTRADPTVVISPLTGATNPCGSFIDGQLTVTLTTAVEAGHTGEVYFIAPGIDHRQVLSYEYGTIAAGGTFVTLPVSFSQFPCQPTVSGKVVYIERDSITGVINRTGDTDTTVTTGNPQVVDVTIDAPSTSGIRGTVTFPVGTAVGEVWLIAKVGEASADIEVQTVDLLDPTFDISAPSIPGVQYRILALSYSFPIGDKITWAYSNVVLPGATGVNLQVPSLGATNQPFGTINDTTPDFVYNQISGTNLNYTYVINGPGTTYAEWLGATSDTSITLPQLPAPARLAAGTQATPTNYVWFALNSVAVRAGGNSDTMLDGRQEEVRHFYFDALFNPDDIGAGSVNVEATPFAIVP